MEGRVKIPTVSDGNANSLMVPSDALPNALAALRHLLVEGASVSAAIAFVTDSGVERLAELVSETGPVQMELVARAGGVTSPEAVLALRDLDVEVSVVLGRDAPAFHPKLWLIRAKDRLSVLSGSGNLTGSGLSENDEQFEVRRVALGCDEAVAHEERFERLTRNALPLGDALETTVWAEWLGLVKQQRALRQLDQMEARYYSREVIPSREADKDALAADLWDLYERTLAANLKQADGRKYTAGRFRIGLNNVKAGADPVAMVARMCRRKFGGFDVILQNNAPEFAVETLVVDEGKTYHDLFPSDTQQISQARLRQFPP